MTRSPGNEIYIGLMSGTSLDGVDVAIIDLAHFPPRFLHCATGPYPDSIRERLRELRETQSISLDELYSLDAELGDVYAQRVDQALELTGLDSDAISAIGCHGQTIRHSPDSAVPYTAQIGDPNRIAAITGITTVADFRRKDIALGGQAAPLAPAFHRFLFRSDDEDRVVVNIGGIANISLLPANPILPVIGFDTGPGNTLCDHWIKKNLGVEFDSNGDWARGGRVIAGLLQDMISTEDYFSARAPKSTGTEHFSPAWLARFLDGEPDARDFQATLVELTVATIANSIGGLPTPPASCFVCGGGARNAYMLKRLQRLLPNCKVQTTDSLGMNPDFVEAAAFAWLARERIELRNGNIPEVTHARRATLLGGIYAAN